MDPATKQENVLSFLIDMKIVAKAAEDKKIADRASSRPSSLSPATGC